MAFQSHLDLLFGWDKEEGAREKSPLPMSAIKPCIHLLVAYSPLCVYYHIPYSMKGMKNQNKATNVKQTEMA